MAAEQQTVRALLDRHGRTFGEELGIDVEKGTPAELSRLLCASTLMSARISFSIAVKAARNLDKRGWRSPQKLAEPDGDLRKLREAAERDPQRERKLLKEFKGIGDVGVDIFFREAQVAWDELRPFADRRALDAAGRLKLGRDPEALAKLVDGKDFPRLVAALVRVELADDHDAVREAARAA